mgnify:CR=1 FL=1|jgi:hypothetical protein
MSMSPESGFRFRDDDMRENEQPKRGTCFRLDATRFGRAAAAKPHCGRAASPL